MTGFEPATSWVEARRPSTGTSSAKTGFEAATLCASWLPSGHYPHPKGKRRARGSNPRRALALAAVFETDALPLCQPSRTSPQLSWAPAESVGVEPTRGLPPRTRTPAGLLAVRMLSSGLGGEASSPTWA